MAPNKQTKFSTIKLFATIILPLFALAIPIVLYFIQLEKKTISYEIISVSDLLAPAQSVPEEFEISFLGNKLENLLIINTRILNNGDIPIKPGDFYKNLILDLGQDSAVLKAVIKDKIPSNLAPEINLKERFIEIVPLLLNPGDYFTIQAYVTGVKASPILETRIAGIKEPKLLSFNRRSLRGFPDRAIYITAVLLVFVYAFLFTVYQRVRRRKLEFGPIYKIDLLVLALVTSFAIALITAEYFWRMLTTSFYIYLIPATTLIIPIFAGLGYADIRFRQLEKT